MNNNSFAAIAAIRAGTRISGLVGVAPNAKAEISFMPNSGSDTTSPRENPAGMKEKINQALLDRLEALCDACPNGEYAKSCPFRLLHPISRPARSALLKDMYLDQVYSLFDLAECCACPKDPRRIQQI